MVNYSCHPVPSQRQRPACTSHRVGDEPLCNHPCPPCPLVVSERRYNREQPKVPGSRSQIPSPHSSFLSLIPRPQMRSFKGNISGNSTCCTHPTQGQTHLWPEDTKPFTTFSPSLQVAKSTPCLDMTPPRRVRREDHLINIWVFLPTMGSELIVECSAKSILGWCKT